MDRPRDPLPTRVADTPPLPDSYRAALDAGLEALGLALSDAARAEIDGQVRLLLAWNQAINLTAVRDPAAIAVRHVVDSLTAVALIGRLHPRAPRIVDIGSGGGFPGLPLAAAIPEARVRLIESLAKKARFLETAVRATGLADRVEVLALRAEALAVDRASARWNVVTARAVAPLADLVELAFPLLGPGGTLIAWKAASAVGEGGELEAARRAIATIDPDARVTIEPAIPRSAGAAVADLADHRLAVVTRTDRAIAGRWPREPAARRRQPW